MLCKDVEGYAPCIENFVIGKIQKKDATCSNFPQIENSLFQNHRFEFVSQCLTRQFRFAECYKIKLFWFSFDQKRDAVSILKLPITTDFFQSIKDPIDSTENMKDSQRSDVRKCQLQCRVEMRLKLRLTEYDLLSFTVASQLNTRFVCQNLIMAIWLVIGLLLLMKTIGEPLSVLVLILFDYAVKCSSGHIQFLR